MRTNIAELTAQHIDSDCFLWSHSYSYSTGNQKHEWFSPVQRYCILLSLDGSHSACWMRWNRSQGPRGTQRRKGDMDVPPQESGPPHRDGRRTPCCIPCFQLQSCKYPETGNAILFKSTLTKDFALPFSTMSPRFLVTLLNTDLPVSLMLVFMRS